MKRVRGAIDRWWVKWEHKLQRLLGHLTPVIAFLLIGMAYYLGVRTERTGFVAEVLDPNLKRITQPVLNAFRGRPPIVHRLVVRLTQERMDSLMTIRENALEAGWLHAEENPRFPVSCSFGEYDFPAILNLRDGPSEQLALRRWPFQLRARDGDTLFHMQSFDMMPVIDMNAVNAWIMQAALRDLGSLAFGHAIIELRLNDQDLGLYTLEGRTDSTLLDLWGRGRGPVMRFDDALLAGSREAMDDRPYGSRPPPQGDWLVAPIMAARSAIMLADPITAHRHQQSVERLEAFRSGKAMPSDIFDIAGLAKLFALSDLLGGQEATEWWNLRFLADSIAETLVVIPQKGSAGRPIESISAMRTGAPLTFQKNSAGFVDKLFNDPIFYKHYIADLDTFSRNGWLEGSLERLRPGIEDRVRIISAEYPQEVLDTNVFFHNRTVIQQTLRPRDLVLAYTQGVQGKQSRLAIANVHAIPITAVGVISGGDTIPFARPITLFPRELDKPLTYTVVNVPMSTPEDRPERLLMNVLGISELRSTPIRTWSTFVAN